MKFNSRRLPQIFFFVFYNVQVRLGRRNMQIRTKLEEEKKNTDYLYKESLVLFNSCKCRQSSATSSVPTTALEPTQYMINDNNIADVFGGKGGIFIL